MKTAQIDILKVTKKADTYIIEYWDESCENENNVTMQISEDSLVEYVSDNGLNHETFINYRMQNLECDGLDERNTDPSAYLDENLHEVIADYITQNS